MIKRRVNFQPQLRVQVTHQKDAGELIVREIPLIALFNQWKQHHIKVVLPRAASYYIECSVSGQINWQKASVFTSSELVGRNNVKVISLKQ